MTAFRPRLTFALLLMTFLAAGGLDAQNHVPSSERVDASLRRRTEIDGNNVRTSVFNFVFSGRTGAGQGVPYEWPKNTGRVYVALVALFFGGEVVDDTGHTVQIVDLPAFRTAPGGADWNMNPVPGYFNLATGKIAKSDEPATWPLSWPDKQSDPTDPGWSGAWNGFFGKNQFNADQELFYRVGDNNYDRYRYTPDTTDRTRKGLGLITDVRVLEWSQASVADAVFFIQEMKNDGTKDIKKTAVTIWLADFVGGDGDSQDDSPTFDLILDIAYSRDSDGQSSFPPFAGTCVGAAATVYLETPGNAEDRIDNDGDGPEFTLGPKVTYLMLLAAGPFPPEVSGNQLDDNHNGLVDEDSTYIPFGAQRGVGFADGIDNNDDGEASSPVVTAGMVAQASTDPWLRWPPNPESDPFWAPNPDGFKQESIHLIQVGSEDAGKRFKDNIDNNNNWYSKPSCLDIPDFPTITQAIIDTAALDAYRRYRVPGTNVVLYDVGPEDIGKRYINREGLHDVDIDEGIDEMMDESRNDGIDNDGDWNPLTDDVGLDGAAGTGDCGEGDGHPTSGVGTPFPGEPNTDKTDVAEGDQIGLTNVQYDPAGGINYSTTRDVVFWSRFMTPGQFVDPSLIGTGEYDLFVSSGLFPLRAGQIERISYAVVMGNETQCPHAVSGGTAVADARAKRNLAELAYNQDYQFAQAPVEPRVTAVTGPRIVNGVTLPDKPQVTLYWDEGSESSSDRFLQGLGAPANDFEGYRIYRATDPAFEDARKIFDANGNPAPWLKPIAQFDVPGDSVAGLHPVAFNGVQFYLGDDTTGLKHSWTDTSVQYGQKYYYAVRAFDKGLVHFLLPNTNPPEYLELTPAESNLKISVDNLTGKVTGTGPSIAIVTPEAPVAGYVAPSISKIQLVQGSTTGFVGYAIVNPDSILDRHRYRITFEDTIRRGSGNNPDTIKTKNFTLADVTDTTAIDTLIARSTALSDTIEQPLTQGFRLSVRNETLFGLNSLLSGWNVRSRPNGIENFGFKQYKFGFTIGLQKPTDYRVSFGSVGIDTSTAIVVGGVTRPSIPVNFSVFNTTENQKIKFGFVELDTTGGRGRLTVRKVGALFQTDFVVFLEPKTGGGYDTTWRFDLAYDSLLAPPTAGDTAFVVLSKLFRATDVFEFTTRAQRVDRAAAAKDLSKIRVVPNPYIVAATWEERSPFSTRQRSIHFTHLPRQCTIRIYTISGELVTTIDHNSTMLDGTEEWNLLSRDNISVSYGVYIFHVDAPGVGEHLGKFAVIK